jgi:hypothetical protein
MSRSTKAVVESGDDKLAILMRAYDRFGYVPIFVSASPNGLAARANPAPSRTEL